MTSDELALFAGIVAKAQTRDIGADVRESILGDVLRLLRSDACVSFAWDDSQARFRRAALHQREQRVHQEVRGALPVRRHLGAPGPRAEPAHADGKGGLRARVREQQDLQGGTRS
ncbi:hypothetical protein ACRAWF_32880 [Streptomyces sp. L7]